MSWTNKGSFLGLDKHFKGWVFIWTICQSWERKIILDDIFPDQDYLLYLFPLLKPSGWKHKEKASNFYSSDLTKVRNHTNWNALYNFLEVNENSKFPKFVKVATNPYSRFAK